MDEVSDWFDESRKFKKDGREGNVVWEPNEEGGVCFCDFGIEFFASFFGSISLFTHERIFSLSILSHDDHVMCHHEMQ